MLASIAEIILENEKNDYRFECFTREICEKHEGVPFVPTSQSWDRGRDARATFPGRGSHRNIICSTLNRDVNAKAEADLLRVTATSSPDRLVYCSSQRLSEERIDDVVKIIRRHAPSGSVLVLGGIQLGALAEKYGDVFEKHYIAEIQAVRSTILDTPAPDAAATRGLRLALIAFGSEEATALRHEILTNSVLELIGDGKPHTPHEITETFSRDLGLHRPLQKELLERTVHEQERKGLVQREGDSYVISDKGRDHLRSLPAQAAAHLLEGRGIVREKLEALIGQGIAETQYEQLWSGLIDFIAALFYANGLEVIRSVDQFLTGSTSGTGEEQNLRALLAEGIKRTASVVSTAELREKIELAILDLVTERTGPAFEWFTRIAERFVILCSLGLEAASGEQVRRALKSHQVVLDTDIILSYLCDAEPDHIRSRDLLARWLRLGGRLLVAPAVLEEVAYHAWISEKDFRETEYLLGKLDKHELTRLIQSAFVRSYHVLEKTANRWPIYIGQFRGNSSGDYTKVLSILRQKLKVETLPESYDDGLRKGITGYLMTHAREMHRGPEQLEDIGYKVERDGKLMASIAAGRVGQERMGSGGPIVLLSSSYWLRRVENRFRVNFGQPNVLISIGALSYLLSTIPDAGLGADSLRRALFEFGGATHLSDVQRRALRIIRATERYDIPWAERGLLEANLNKAMREDAEKCGTSESVLRSKLISGQEPHTAARLIVHSLTEMAIKDKTSEELAEARRRIAELEGQIVTLEESLKMAKTKS